MWTARGVAVAVKGSANPLFFHWFPVVLHCTCSFLAQVQSARAVGSGGRRTVGIAEMLCFATVFFDFLLMIIFCGR